MTLPEFIYRFDGFASFLVNAIICVFAATLYHDTRKRCLLLIAIGSGLGAALGLWPEMQDGSSSWVAWYVEMILRIGCSAVWLVGCWRLFRDYSDLISRSAQPDSAPDSGPPSQSPASPEEQSSEAQRTPSSGGCG